METTLERAKSLESILLAACQNDQTWASVYEEHRMALMAKAPVSQFVPEIVRTCLDLNQFWMRIRTVSPTYKGRREHVAEVMKPIFEHLAGITRAQGSFIPAGNSFDAFVAVGKVLGTATRDILIVDPYLDEKALTDFAPLAQEGVSIRLLADGSAPKPTLIPASKRWATQYGAARPLEMRLAPARTLHDRVIVTDAAGVWVLTQSLNAFAGRSPATIVRVDQETAALKVSAYDAIWRGAAPI